jgi:glycerol-1-phosphate dehydrogenase [NAD(P)+]
MIRLEEKEGKYDPARHAVRLERILARWDDLTAVMRSLPSAVSMTAFYRRIGFPTEPEGLGMTADEVRLLIRFAADIRDKYVLTRLLWDLGEPADGVGI